MRIPILTDYSAAKESILTQIQMAAMLYESRDSMKFLYREEGKYEEMISEYQSYITKVVGERKCTPLAAVIAIIKENDVAEVGKLRLFAAYVELAESPCAT